MRTAIVETLVEWDDNKNRLNIKKHGIRRDEAARIISARMANSQERRIYYGE